MYETYTRFLNRILINRKYQIVSPIKAEGQKDKGAKAVDATTPATPAYKLFTLHPVKCAHYAIYAGPKTKILF